jgi:hypothetical protein
VQEKTNELDIVEFISTLPGSYPDICVKKNIDRYEPIDKKVSTLIMADEINYMFNKWNVSKPDRKKLIELLINIKALQ